MNSNGLPKNITIIPLKIQNKAAPEHPDNINRETIAYEGIKVDKEASKIKLNSVAIKSAGFKVINTKTKSLSKISVKDLKNYLTNILGNQMAGHNVSIAPFYEKAGWLASKRFVVGDEPIQINDNPYKHDEINSELGDVNAFVIYFYPDPK